jgi:hypothetical protein
MFYEVRQISVVRGLQRDQQRPFSFVNRLHTHVSALIVTREIQRWLEHRPDESLMIVGRRVDQVAEDLRKHQRL